MFKFSPLVKRLMPLYISRFFQGLILWYAIEKLFMTEIGFTPQTISWMVIVVATTTILLEIPLGVLADRWSRKGMLVIANIALAAASLFLGLADSVSEYLIASVLYGVYAAADYGAEEAVMYDTVLEERGTRKGFEKYYGYLTLTASVAWVAGSLVGGVVAVAYGLPAAYLWTVPLMLISVIVLLFFREPTLHKQDEAVAMATHLKDIFRLLTRRGIMIWLAAAMIAGVVVSDIFLEFDQLWLIELNLPLEWYGAVNALFLLALGVGAPLAHLLRERMSLLPLSYFILVVSLLALVFQNIYVAVAALVMVIIVSTALYVVGLGLLNDHIPSRYRSGVSATLTTVSRLLLLPVVLVFGFIAENQSIFTTPYLMLPFVLLLVGGLVAAIFHYKKV